MINIPMNRTLLWAIVALLFYQTTPLLAQQCQRRGVIISDADVFESLP